MLRAQDYHLLLSVFSNLLQHKLKLGLAVLQAERCGGKVRFLRGVRRAVGLRHYTGVKAERAQGSMIETYSTE